MDPHDPQLVDGYQRAHDEASAKAGGMPNWMLRRCVSHSIRLALTGPYKASRSRQETAWGSADGFADEILRRRVKASAEV